MARTPDGLTARTKMTSFRLEETEVDQMDRQARARGGMTRSTYLRWLLDQDNKRIAREQGGMA